MIEEIKLEEEDSSSENNSFDDNYNNQSTNDLYLFSKENDENANEYFETEFKKVFNDKDTFGTFKREEEKEVETQENSQSKVHKKKIFKLISNSNKFMQKRNNLRRKKIFTVLGKNNFENYGFDELILYIKKLNNSSKASPSASNKINLLKLERKLILELKDRILNQIKANQIV